MNSLRSNDALSPTPKKRNVQHTGCKGTAHGHGNYSSPETNPEPCPFQRTPSIKRNNSSVKASNDGIDTKTNSVENCSESDPLDLKNGKPSPFQRTSSLRGSRGKMMKKPPLLPKPKTASISSENYSETDSIDSSETKTKCSEETSKKQDEVCSRLFSSGTKASEAKTAKMRHLDIFDVDETGWMSGLRKVTDDANINIQKKKALVNGSEADNPFMRSRNGSIRRSGKIENLNKIDNGAVSNGHTPKPIPRNSFRKGVKKSKFKCVDYDEVQEMSRNRKNCGFFSVADIANCYKGLEDFSKEIVDSEVSFYLLLKNTHLCNLFFGLISNITAICKIWQML